MTHKPKLQNITISLPDIYCDNLKDLQNIGIIASRSEGIRIAVREFLEKEIDNAKLMGFELKEQK